MGRIALAVGLVLVLFAASCGDDGEIDKRMVTDEDLQEMQDELDEAKPCAKVFAEGAEVTEASYEKVCKKGDEAHIAGTADTECTDGRVLLWNDFAWGYKGETWHPHKDGAEQVAPESERLTCQASSDTDY
jgi:hypothetical protein